MYRSIAPCGTRCAPKQYIRGVLGGLVLFSLLVSISCTQSDTQREAAKASSTPNAPVVKKDNYITANPNPVPAGPENGTTTITWQTKGLTAVDVHVFVVGGDGIERLFATGSDGSQTAPWIISDAPAEFSLVYGSGADRKLLDKIVVTRNK